MITNDIGDDSFENIIDEIFSEADGFHDYENDEAIMAAKPKTQDTNPKTTGKTSIGDIQRMTARPMRSTRGWDKIDILKQDLDRLGLSSMSIPELRAWMEETRRDLHLSTRILNKKIPQDTIAAYRDTEKELAELWPDPIRVGNAIRDWAIIAQHIRWCDVTGFRTFVSYSDVSKPNHYVNSLSLCSRWGEIYEIIVKSGYEKQFLDEAHSGHGDVLSGQCSGTLFALSLSSNTIADKVAAFALYMEFCYRDSLYVDSRLLLLIAQCSQRPYDDETNENIRLLLHSYDPELFYRQFIDYLNDNSNDGDKILGLLRFCRKTGYDWDLVATLLRLDYISNDKIIDYMSKLGNVNDDSLIDRLRLLPEYESKLRLYSIEIDEMLDSICDDSIATPPRVFWEDLIAGEL